MDHVVTRRLPRIPQLLPTLLSSRTSVVRGLSSKSWLSLCRLAAKRCPQRDRRNNTSLGQRSHAFAPGVLSRVLRSGPTRAGVSSFGADGLQRHVRGLLRSRRIGGLVLSIDGHNFSNVQVRLAVFAHSLLAAALPAQRPRDHRAHKFHRKTCGSTSLGAGFTVKTYS